MNLEHIVSDYTGLVHLISSVMALIFGSLVLLSTKGTKKHKNRGYWYAGSMVILLITAFMMYNLYGRFAIFHWAAVVSTVTLIGGMIPMILKKPKSYVSLHFNFMYWSVFGLYGAFMAEVLVRVPRAVVTDGNVTAMFYNILGIAVFITMGTGYFIMAKMKKKWSGYDQSLVEGVNDAV